MPKIFTATPIADSISVVSPHQTLGKKLPQNKKEAMEFRADLAHELMPLKPSKLSYFQQDLRAITLIPSAL
ncbi:MAG: hypothetical protein RMY34_10880 [Aulosira sp. DedQUE10]|nr:hypothetical protein [Aulosira sp. DedQUE10]